jgi:hypothetical protein
MSSDPSGQRHRDMGRLQTGAAAQNAVVAMLLLRVLFFPVWLPIHLWKRSRQNREMSLLAAELIHENPFMTPKEIALKWALAHRKQYRYGELDPKLPKLEERFSETVARLKQG